MQPLLPGEKRVKEWWENLWVYGMGGNMLLLILVAIFKPDTRSSERKIKYSILIRYLFPWLAVLVAGPE